MTERTFRAIFVLIPCLSFAIIPTAIFGIAIGEWGSNLIWGRVFGFGWFLAQSFAGPTHWHISTVVGIFVWPPLIAYAIFLASGPLYRRATQHVRNAWLIVMLFTAAAVVPAHVVEADWRPGSVPTDFMVLLNSY